MKWFDAEKQMDVIDENLQPDISFRINKTTRWFAANIFGRALSYLVGWTGTAAKMLRCTSAGILRVAVEGGGYETNDTRSGTAGVAWSADIIPDETATKVEVWTFTQDMDLRRSNNDYAWDDTIILEAGSYYSFDASTYRIAVKRNAGVDATYRIVFWF